LIYSKIISFEDRPNYYILLILDDYHFSKTVVFHYIIVFIFQTKEIRRQKNQSTIYGDDLYPIVEFRQQEARAQLFQPPSATGEKYARE
jgi:hypothetical protein